MTDIRTGDGRTISVTSRLYGERGAWIDLYRTDSHRAGVGSTLTADELVELRDALNAVIDDNPVPAAAPATAGVDLATSLATAVDTDAAIAVLTARVAAYKAVTDRLADSAITGSVVGSPDDEFVYLLTGTRPANTIKENPTP